MQWWPTNDFKRRYMQLTLIVLGVGLLGAIAVVAFLYH